VLLTAKAMALEAEDPAQARKLAGEAHSLAPDLVPAAVVYGRLLSAQGEVRKASKTLEATWRHQPHPELADVYAGLKPGENSAERLKRMTQLVGLAVSHPESAMALARAAIQANDFAAARDALAPWANEAPSQRICLMMAEICSKDGNDLGRAREWMAKALRAPRDPVWTADGQVSDKWLPFSPVSGRLDAFEWKVPLAELGGPILHVDDVLADAHEPVAPRPVLAVIDNAEPAIVEAVVPAVDAPVEDTPAPVIDANYVPPLPDDPGPGEGPPPKKRFSLFGG
jgi:HemY protein